LRKKIEKINSKFFITKNDINRRTMSLSFNCKGCAGKTPGHLVNIFPGDGKYCPTCTDIKSTPGRGTFVADTPSSLGGLGGTMGYGGMGLGGQMGYGGMGLGGPNIPDAVLIGLITGAIKDPQCVKTSSGWVCSAKNKDKKDKKSSSSK
jgi:hypothetical protein